MPNDVRGRRTLLRRQCPRRTVSAGARAVALPRVADRCVASAHCANTLDVREPRHLLDSRGDAIPALARRPQTRRRETRAPPTPGIDLRERTRAGSAAGESFARREPPA